ncbi:MAG: GNAT family N-acetyltransferase [Pseudomonadota bacterium]|nr:GNAT family N-acetyltransferase [Pseudomonadota bacterium]
MTDMACFLAAARHAAGPSGPGGPGDPRRAPFAARAASRVETPRLLRRALPSVAGEPGSWSGAWSGVWAVIRRDDRAVLGQVSLTRHAGWRVLALGWALAPAAEAAGAAVEAAAALRDRAFDAGADAGLGLVSFLDAFDAAALSVARRLGARPDPLARAPRRGLQVWRHAPDLADGVHAEGWR